MKLKLGMLLHSRKQSIKTCLGPGIATTLLALAGSFNLITGNSPMPDPGQYALKDGSGRLIGRSELLTDLLLDAVER